MRDRACWVFWHSESDMEQVFPGCVIARGMLDAPLQAAVVEELETLYLFVCLFVLVCLHVCVHVSRDGALCMDRSR